MLTMREYIEQTAVRMTAKMVAANPNMSDMPEGSTHWKCVLRWDDRQFTITFSQGPAHIHEPRLDEVLDCLASDAAGIENATNFEEWAGEYGYDTDSRKAERIHDVCQRQAAGLKRLLSGPRYADLLWRTERL